MLVQHEPLCLRHSPCLPWDSAAVSRHLRPRAHPAQRRPSWSGGGHTDGDRRIGNPILCIFVLQGGPPIRIDVLEVKSLTILSRPPSLPRRIDHSGSGRAVDKRPPSGCHKRSGFDDHSRSRGVLWPDDGDSARTPSLIYRRSNNKPEFGCLSGPSLTRTR